MAKIIGGEFDIDISSVSGSITGSFEGYLYSSGRAALYNILLDIKNRGNRNHDTILLPDYLCESVLEAVLEFDFKIVFYNLAEDLLLNEGEVIDKIDENTIVLLINYFGCIDYSTIIRSIKEYNSGTIIIQDNVQALFEMYNESEADYIFTSFRKTIQAPDGGWVKTKLSGLPVANYNNTFAEYKIAGGILKNMASVAEINEQLYLDLFKKGEDKLNENFRSAPSSISLDIFHSFEKEKTAEIRRRNTDVIINGLNSLDIPPIVDIKDSHIPLFVPVRLNNRDDVRKQFFKENIFCPIHWPVPQNYDLSRGKELAATELSIITDQRYTADDMYRILDIIQKFV